MQSIMKSCVASHLRFMSQHEHKKTEQNKKDFIYIINMNASKKFTLIFKKKTLYVKKGNVKMWVTMSHCYSA